jgi:site-specific DNA-methyltransferase (adenine-specific)
LEFDRIVPIKRKQGTSQLELDVPTRNGITHPVLADGGVQLHYENKSGKLYLGDSVEWLKSLETASVDLVFADPPYNVKRADWDHFESHAQYVSWSHVWIAEAARLLKPTGTMYVCGYSEILASIQVSVMPLFRGCRWLVWH